MKVIIPSDWDGETWTCVQIQWPYSVEWLAVLNGLLSQAMRGRLWDEKTGSVVDVQEIGKEIWARNKPFVICQDCDDGEQEPTVIYLSDGSMGDDDEMGQVVTEIKAIPGGIRVYYGHCCYEDFLCCDIAPTGDPGDDWSLDDPGDETQVFYPCGKVSSLIDALDAMMVTGLQYYTSPVEFVGKVKDAVPAVDMTTSYLYLLLFDFASITKLVSNETIRNDDMVSAMKCAAARVASATAESDITEFESVIQAVQNAIFNSVGDYGAATLVWTLWEQCYQSIGALDCVLLLKLGAEDSTADCTCDQPIETSSIYFDGGMTGPNSQGGVLEDYHTEYGGRRMWFRFAYSAGGDNKGFTDCEPSLAGAQAGDYVTFRVYKDEQSQWTPGVPTNQSLTVGCDTPSNWMPQFESYGGNPGTRDNFNDEFEYFEFTTVQGEPTALPQSCKFGGWRCPGAQGSDYRESFYIEIVGVNGTRFTPIGP